MPAVARGSGTDTVLSKTGVGKNCARPTDTVTNECSPDVFCNSIGVVRYGDLVGIHNKAGCTPDTSTLSSGSSTIFVNGQKLGRIGDMYTADNIITSGSENTFAG